MSQGQLSRSADHERLAQEIEREPLLGGPNPQFFAINQRRAVQLAEHSRKFQNNFAHDQ